VSIRLLCPCMASRQLYITEIIRMHCYLRKMNTYALVATNEGGVLVLMLYLFKSTHKRETAVRSDRSNLND
jgi:hypothetical protein